MNFARISAAIAAVAATIPCLQADVKMPEIFSSHMVLQRDVKLPVWGKAAPGENVTVSINGQEKSTVADAQGNWKTELDAIPAGGPFVMAVKGNNSINIDDVMVGEVWLCSGQSNMEWSVKSSNNSDKEIPAANYPNIRLFHVQKDWQNLPLTNFGKPVTWKACTPENIPGFSAVGYFFGRELNQKLGIPVGLINSSWGGTYIEPWTPPVGFDQIPALSGIQKLLQLKSPTSPLHKETANKTIAAYKAWAENADKAVNANQPLPVPPVCPAELLPFKDHQQPTVLFNGMINPMVPYALRGAIWYQGESNLGDGMMYAEKMKALIGGWRTVFNNPALAFYFVQLAPYNYKNNPEIGARLWESQCWVAKNVPGTGMAVINDIGNLTNIHPTNKQDVGLRLANLALNRNYGKKDVVCDSPTFKAVKFDGAKAIVSFDGAQGLKTRDGKAPSHFELSAADGIFKKAAAVIEGENVVLTAEGINAPLVVRFAWSIIAEPNLMNGAGLPASSFRFGELPVRADLDSLVPEAKDYKLVYAIDPTQPKMIANGTGIEYSINDAAAVVGEVNSIAYFLKLVKQDNSVEYVFVAMDPFTTDLKTIGVPVKIVNDRFQTKVKNLFVKSNVKGVENGSFPEGNIEFWDCNYGPANALNIPDASNDKMDFGDKFEAGVSPGYGSMQVHNFAKKQTVFAFNDWQAGNQCDLGIGNSPTGHPDWTFRRNAGEYKSGVMMVLVKTNK